MKMAISEIADRLSIAILKHHRTDTDMTEEISLYRNELINYDGIEKFIELLIDINGKIWNLEADIRLGKESILGLEEVGKRALLIRDLNKIRVGYKNQLVELYKEGFIDIKINHASE